MHSRAVNFRMRTCIILFVGMIVVLFSYLCSWVNLQDFCVGGSIYTQLVTVIANGTNEFMGCGRAIFSWLQ